MASAIAAVQKSPIDPTGGMHVADLAIPPSNFWSPEFLEWHRRLHTGPAPDFTSRIPSRNAPRTEWDRFDRWMDQNYNDALQRRARERYPVEIVETSLGGVRVAVVYPGSAVGGAIAGRVLINLHGGGFVYNRGLSYGLAESIPVACLGRITVITVDYRQAPHFSYPAASEDVEAVYKDLLRKYQPGSVGMFGCSAGGALAAQSLARFKNRGLPAPGAIGIFSMAPPPPWDPPVSREQVWGDSGMWFSGLPKNALSDLDLVRLRPMKWYMETASPDDPEAYPGTFDSVLENFPPTLFLSGTRDFAFSAVAVSHARLLKLGVDSQLYVMEGARHAAHVLAVDTPEAHDAHAYVARWFNQKLPEGA